MESGGGEFDAWLDGQSRYARQVLDAAPQRPSLLRRIVALRQGGAQRMRFAFAGRRMFWLREDPGLAVSVLMVDERALFDPSAAEDGRAGHRHLDWYVPSPDGRLVAVAVSVGGGETCTVRVVDVESGALRDDAVCNVRFPFLSWLPDGERFVYHQYRDSAPGEAPAVQRLDSRSRLHRLGTDSADDPVLLARGINPALPLQPLDRPFVYRPAGTDLLVAVISHGALRGDRVDEKLSACTIYVAPVAGAGEPGVCPWVRFAGPDDEVSAWAVGPDALYLLGGRDAPNGRVLLAPLADPTRRAEFVPHSDRVLEAVRVVGDDLLIRELVGGVHGLRRVPLSGDAPVPVALPVDGTILEWASAPTGLLLRVESWTHAPTVYRCDPATGAVTDTGWGARNRDPTR